MKKILSENKIFIIPYLVIAIAVSTVVLLYTKIDLHIIINQHHNHFFDIFFKYITHLGDGIIAIIVSIILLFIRYRWAIISIISSLIILGLIQFLKRVVFTDFSRPVLIFDYLYKGAYKLYIIPGTDPGINHSFPSGHSATAFATFFMLALIVKNKTLKLLLFTIAVLVAFSRVYLSWHFSEDALAGSFIGIIVSLLTFSLINKSKKDFLDNSLIKKQNK